MGLFDNLFAPDMELGVQSEDDPTTGLTDPNLGSTPTEAAPGLTTLPPQEMQPFPPITAVDAAPHVVTSLPVVNKSSAIEAAHNDWEKGAENVTKLFETPEPASVTSPMSTVPPTAFAEAPVGIAMAPKPLDTTPTPAFVDAYRTLITPTPDAPAPVAPPFVIDPAPAAEKFTLQNLDTEALAGAENKEVEVLREQIATLETQMKTVLDQQDQLKQTLQAMRKGLASASSAFDEPAAMDITRTTGLHLAGEDNGLESKLPTKYTTPLAENNAVNFDATTSTIASNVTGVDRFMDKLAPAPTAPVQTAA